MGSFFGCCQGFVSIRRFVKRTAYTRPRAGGAIAAREFPYWGKLRAIVVIAIRNINHLNATTIRHIRGDIRRKYGIARHQHVVRNVEKIPLLTNEPGYR